MNGEKLEIGIMFLSLFYLIILPLLLYNAFGIIGGSIVLLCISLGLLYGFVMGILFTQIKSTTARRKNGIR